MHLKNCLIVAGLVLAAPALQAADVEYSADSSMETADGTMNATVYVAPGMERRESVNDGVESIMIIRRDKNLMWMLQPEEKMYMEMALGQSGGRKDDISAYKIDHTTIGPDTLNGIKTTKSKLIMVGPKGDKLGGLMWTTEEGIVVKMDAIAVDKSSKERLKTELTNLKIGKQEPSLFEIPSDYSKMDMGGFGNMMLNGGGEDDKKQPEAKDEKKGFGWKSAIDLLKKPH